MIYSIKKLIMLLHRHLMVKWHKILQDGSEQPDVCSCHLNCNCTILGKGSLCQIGCTQINLATKEYDMVKYSKFFSITFKIHD